MPPKKVKFEDALARIGEIVSQLERGEAPLEQSVALFEEGTRLIQSCNKQLDSAEQKVYKLSKGPDGNPVREPMETEE